MLKFNGLGHFPGIPSKDLSDEEVLQFGGEEFLLSTGLYYRPQEQVKPRAIEKEKTPVPKPRKKSAVK